MSLRKIERERETNRFELTNNWNYVYSAVSSIETDTFQFHSTNFKFSTFADSTMNDFYNVNLPLVLGHDSHRIYSNRNTQQLYVM